MKKNKKDIYVDDAGYITVGNNTDYLSEYSENLRPISDREGSRTTVTGVNTSSSYDPNQNYEQGGNLLQRQLIATPVWKQAYKLFSRDNNPIWLQRLQSILFGLIPYSGGAFDGIFTSKSENADSQTLVRAIEQIQSLLEQYQQYKNSLPVNQVSQMADAGMNPVLTGGIGASSLEETQAPTIEHGTTTETASGLESFSNVVNVVSSLMDTSVSLVSTALDVKKMFTEFGEMDRRYNLDADKLGLDKEQFDAMKDFMQKNFDLDVSNLSLSAADRGILINPETGKTIDGDNYTAANIAKAGIELHDASFELHSKSLAYDNLDYDTFFDVNRDLYNHQFEMLKLNMEFEREYARLRSRLLEVENLNADNTEAYLNAYSPELDAASFNAQNEAKKIEAEMVKLQEDMNTRSLEAQQKVVNRWHDKAKKGGFRGWYYGRLLSGFSKKYGNNISNPGEEALANGAKFGLDLAKLFALSKFLPK